MLNGLCFQVVEFCLKICRCSNWYYIAHFERLTVHFYYQNFLHFANMLNIFTLFFLMLPYCNTSKCFCFQETDSFSNKLQILYTSKGYFDATQVGMSIIFQGI